MAKGLTEPACIGALEPGAARNVTWTSPRIRASTASPPLRYITLVRFNPSCDMSSIICKLVGEPPPVELKFNCPGFSFANATNSLSVLAGTAGLTSNSEGCTPNRVMGVKSLLAS